MKWFSVAIAVSLLGVPAIAQTGAPAVTAGFNWSDVQRSRRVPTSELPAAARSVADKELARITEVERVTMRDGRTLYVVEGRAADRQEWKLVLTPTGEVTARVNWG